MFIYKWKVAARMFCRELKFPVRRMHAWRWDENDHEHICIAARILETKDFKMVCPCGGKCEIESDDICDDCQYLRIINFRTDKKGRNHIELI